MAITERYVTSSAGGSGDGSSGNPWTLAQAFTNATAGDRINIKNDATYTRSASDAITNAGTTTSPIIWRGYSSSIGDATLARSAGGAISTTNMPTISYNSTFKFSTNANYNVFESIVFAGSVSGATAGTTAGESTAFYNCVATNSSTNAAAAGFALVGTRSRCINCDASVGASGGLAAINATGGTSCSVVGCRVTCAGAIGIKIEGNGYCYGNTAYSCGTDGIALITSTSTISFINNTIYSCAGDGLDISAAVTNPILVLGNHITDNTGYGVNTNGGIMAVISLNNRFRGNGSGATNGQPDWFNGTNIRNVTSGSGASSDYKNAGSLDFSLIAAAPAVHANIGYLIDIGANGDNATGGMLIHPGLSGGARG